MLTRAFLALMGLSCAAEAQDPNLTITWIGQSCFVMRTDGGPTVITDPPAASVGYTLPRLAADAVTITHNHTDHNNAVAVGGTFTLIDGRGVMARRELTAAGLGGGLAAARLGARPEPTAIPAAPDVERKRLRFMTESQPVTSYYIAPFDGMGHLALYSTTEW